MTKEEFVVEFSNELSRLLEDVAEVIVKENVMKVNEIKTGLSIRFPDSEVAPTIYVDEIYKNLAPGETPEMAARKVADNIDGFRENAPNLSEIDLSKVGAQKNLYMVAINAEQNKELLKDVPHHIQDDLALIARYRVSEEASFIVRECHCEQFKMTSEEVLEQAMKNTDERGYTVQGINEVLRELMGGMPEDYMEDVLAETPQSPFYVVSNDLKVDGAVAIASKKALEQVHEVVGENYYILPSSRHEILAVPDSLVSDPEDLKQMVCEVNATEVSVSDKLSDNIYHYDARTKSVSMVDTQKMDKSIEMAETLTISHTRAM